MKMDSDFDGDINSLRGFVSDTIFEFLAGEVASPLSVDPATSGSSTLTDEELLEHIRATSKTSQG